MIWTREEVMSPPMQGLFQRPQVGRDMILALREFNRPRTAEIQDMVEFIDHAGGLPYELERILNGFKL